jgi:hypothetical protein
MAADTTPADADCPKTDIAPPAFGAMGLLTTQRLLAAGIDLAIRNRPAAVADVVAVSRLRH